MDDQWQVGPCRFPVAQVPLQPVEQRQSVSHLLYTRHDAARQIGCDHAGLQQRAEQPPQQARVERILPGLFPKGQSRFHIQCLCPPRRRTTRRRLFNAPMH
jgi:hypothetical protein